MKATQNERKKDNSSNIYEIRPIYETEYGSLYNDKIESFLDSDAGKSIKGKVNLIVTSPPFPLIRKKRYGNESGEAYLKWLEDLSPKLTELLTDDGSIVIEIGNAWVKGLPEMSTLPLEALLAFKKAANLHLCQHVICHNTARIPSPAQWVTIERIRLKDSFTHVWWLSKTPRPKADNREVLAPYSKDMMKLIKTGRYNSGKRPSGHEISTGGFLKDNGGSIQASMLEDINGHEVSSSMLKMANTGWDADYRNYCKDNNLEAHPARMQHGLVAFFVKYLTRAGDLCFDPFGGSNTTGWVAEAMGRRWMAVEANRDYAHGSYGRFQ